MNDTSWRSSARNEVLMERALLLKNIRAFFDSRGVVEVETPLLSQHSTTDPHLDGLSSRFRDKSCYLNTSPEYAMKRLLAGWPQAIYQTCKAFRDDELGPNHNPEFSMLEWYRPGYSMEQLMDELAELVQAVYRSSRFSQSNDPVSKKPVFERLSYQQAFERFVGFNPHQASAAQCYQIAKVKNVEIPQGLSVADKVDEWLDWLLTQLVFPAFNRDGFTFLYDYPESQCALAKIMLTDPIAGAPVPVAKRFELFYGDIELANGFLELTDAKEQQQRFLSENQAREQAGKKTGCVDDYLIAALNSGLPDCAGVAMGLDRLLMVLVDAKDIEQVLAFPWARA